MSSEKKPDAASALPRYDGGMRRAELLRRIDELLNRRRWSDRKACLAAGLTQDFIRNLRRHPEWGVKAEKLTSLARTLDVAPAYFIDEEVNQPSGELRLDVLDRDRLRDAQRAADRAMQGENFSDPETIRANLTAFIYDSLTARARQGKPLRGEAAEDFVDGLIRGIVADSLKNR